MFTREDPWVNVLRSTLAAFGASVGGADSITVLPYDTVLGLPERFGRRLARNTQILLADESNVGRVTDPGGGSWYLESLTDQVADAVWARFQEVEAAGGVVTRVRRRPAPRVGRRRHRRAGPRPGDPAHAAHGRLDVPARRRGPAEPPPPSRPGRYRPGPRPRPRRHRPSRRCATAPWRSATGRRSSSAPLGTRRDFGARQTFVANLLAAGGIAATESGSTVAVIASSPRAYAEHAAQAVADLRAAGARLVLVAGRAHELGDDAGLVDGEVHDGMDVVAVLDALLTRLETEGAR